MIRLDSPSTALAISIVSTTCKAELLSSFFTLHASGPTNPETPRCQRRTDIFSRLLISLAALLLRAVMAPLWETTAPFALFMFATVITAWFAGIGPAILTGARRFRHTTVLRFARADPVTYPSRGKKPVRLTLFAGFVVGAASS